jgi:transcriptional regulator with XRE-family HTH domain
LLERDELHAWVRINLHALVRQERACYPAHMHTDHAFADTRAAQMLREGLARRKAEGVSLRELARRLRYRQSTVLSQMANGRVGIPPGRAIEIARIVDLPEADFARAVSEQRAGAEFTQAMVGRGGTDAAFLPERDDEFLNELEEIAGRELRHLTLAQKRVLREVVVDPQADRRWLSVAELPALALLREVRPAIREIGLDARDKEALRKALAS